MNRFVKKFPLALSCLYLSGLLFVLFAYQKGQLDSEFLHIYLYSGVLVALLVYRVSSLYVKKYKLDELISRDKDQLIVQSASGFINYSQTAIPVNHIRALTITHGSLIVDLKGQQQLSHLEFFFPFSKAEIQNRILSLFSSSELTKIQLNLLAE